jgi:glyoxylase-like metal-dependent hydrolase (beta-lactamase superfamily II)
MEIIHINPGVTAFIRPAEGANVGLIDTSEGIILIDTTSSPGDMQALLQAAAIHVEEIKLVINTHFHSDHTWGNQVFSCPIVAQRQCLARMQAALKDDWSMEELQAYIAELEKTDPPHAAEVRKMVDNLKITLPDQLFEDQFTGVMGGLSYEIIHLGGHTPDTSIVWLPSEKVLFSSDLIFQGRYPYIFDAHIPAWIAALNKLLEFDALAIIPGHGARCTGAEILYLRDYLQHSWERTKEHIQLGHTARQAAADPGYPIYSTDRYKRLHKANIRYMYRQLKKNSS